MPSPTEQTESGNTEPSPPVSLTPEQQEEAGRLFDAKFIKGVARGAEKLKEAERLGVPLHKLVPVN